MKVLIVGKGGQLAWELEQSVPSGYQVTSLDKDGLDITDETAVKETIKELQPDLVINAAAYTAVDAAETDRETAFAVNELGPRYLAGACESTGARLLHVSTDFVFDGNRSTPYQTDDMPNPINVYGASKLAGEVAVAESLPGQSVVVRTAWVYSSFGNNFVKTMLRLMEEKSELGIVYDQIGTPTWARGLANWLWAIASRPDVSGTFHWTDAGVASWYDFAVAIQELAMQRGLLAKRIPLRPIPASSYPTPAQRPVFSVIDKSSAEKAADLSTVHWRSQLAEMLDQLLVAEKAQLIKSK